MPNSILAVGDNYLPTDDMAPILAELGPDFSVTYRTVDPADRPPLAGITEYQGSPDALSGWLGDEDVLLVHAAPVTAELLDRHPHIKVVACARGGAVNVDIAAAAERGVLVLNTPAKNADSVADLTMAYLHLLFRGVTRARAWLEGEARAGATHLDSTFVGGQWIAREPRGHTLGLVGYGAIGTRVARQAVAAGLRVLVFDPYATITDDIRTVGLDELLASSDAVSVHARATAETRHLINEDFLRRMKPGAFLVNTARESLLDERALLAALDSGHLGGAALDVCEPDGLWPQFATLPQVIITPHLGGATVQTQERSLRMLVADLTRWAHGDEPLHRALPNRAS